jgi:tRNA (guanine37-N1)-methyltransferase
VRVAIVTLFPELFEPFARLSFVGKAVESGRLTLHIEPLREHGLGRHRSVDDTPYGGGSGMVMRPDCIVSALERVDQIWGQTDPAHRVLLTPQGAPFTQAQAAELAERPAVSLVCGRYEGFDERVRHFVDAELSVGDYVLTGGEVAAMAVLEAMVRLIPGVLGNSDSPREESFSSECGGLLEYPQYTRPAGFRGHEVPEVLRSGDHGRIAEWRREQSLARTRSRRPALLGPGSGPEESEDP